MVGRCTARRGRRREEANGGTSPPAVRTGSLLRPPVTRWPSSAPGTAAQRAIPGRGTILSGNAAPRLGVVVSCVMNQVFGATPSASLQVTGAGLVRATGRRCWNARNAWSNTHRRQLAPPGYTADSGVRTPPRLPPASCASCASPPGMPPGGRACRPPSIRRRTQTGPRSARPRPGRWRGSARRPCA